MKTAIIVMLAITVGVASAKAQRGHGYYHGGGGRTIIVSGGYYNPYYAYGAFSPYYGYPYNGYRIASRPSKLDMQVAEIRNDYADKIESVRLDNTLPGKERRAKIREFRRQRDADVLAAKQNYYKK